MKMSLIAMSAVLISSLTGVAANRVALDGCSLGFSIRLGRVGDTNVAERIVTEADMRTLEVAEADGVRTVTWKGSALCGDGFAVVAVLTRTPEGLLDWQARYAGQTSGLDVLEFDFPTAFVPYRKESRYFRSFSQGMLVKPDWDAEPCAGRIARLGTHMWPAHFTALLNGDAPSFYMDQRNDLGHATRVECSKERPGELRIEFLYYLPVTTDNNRAFALPFGGRLGLFRGGWYEAAMLYAPWARTRPNYLNARRNFDLSRHREIGLWMWNRGRIEDVVPPLGRFAADAGVPVALDWYWWHANPYDTSYPNFWPPREGVAAFTNAVADLNRAGVFSQVYTNGQRWDCDDPSFAEGGEEGQLVRRDGRPDAHMYNPFTRHRLTQMCGEAPKYQERMVGLSKKLRGTGLSGLYMDQIAMTSYEPCYNLRHHHAPGGGDAVVRGFREYVRRVRAANPGWPLSGEDPNEAYMDLFESVIVCYPSIERYRRGMGFKPADEVEMVPVYSAIYHGAVALFGSYAMMDGVPPWDELWPAERRWKSERPWHRLFPDQYAVEFCRGVVWGQQPTVHNFKAAFADDPEFREDYRFTIETARFYFAHREALFDGEMLNPGRMSCDARDVKFLVRGTFAAEGEYQEFVAKALPTVLHSVWRTPDGRVGAVLVNWTREPRDYRLQAPDIGGIREGLLPARSWKWIDREVGK